MDIRLAEESSVTRPNRRRLAIVSTFDELCGIASYTRSLLPQLALDFDIEVMDLDQYLVKNRSARVQILADEHIRQIAKDLSLFDNVNIQLEHGTLGRTPKQILRRFKLLANAALSLSVTFHTVMSDERFAWSDFFGHVFSGHWGKARALARSYRRSTILTTPLYTFLRKLAKEKPVHLIVHSKREMRLLKNVYRLKNVHDHPLSYLDATKASEIRSNTSRASFPGLATIPEQTILIGTFGFLSPYKGFETVIQAMNYLPANYHMLIFGGIHPETIKKGVSIDNYLSRLLQQANVNQTVFDTLSNPTLNRLSRDNLSRLNLTIDVGNDTGLLTSHPKDMSSRIHFMGALSDSDFAAAMSVCDTIVVPYMEVGQSASGPVSMALDMGCRVIASRTLTFLQLSRYHPGAFEMFDIGNFLELAQRIQSPPPNDANARCLRFNTLTNAAIYRKANGFSEQLTKSPHKLESI